MGPTTKPRKKSSKIKFDTIFFLKKIVLRGKWKLIWIISFFIKVDESFCFIFLSGKLFSMRDFTDDFEEFFRDVLVH